MSRLVRIDASRAVFEPLRGKTVAVLGFGNQGEAHALNLRDSGCHVIVGQRPGSDRHVAAVRAGFEPVSLRLATESADALVFGLPDDAAPALFHQEIGPHLRSGQTLGFMHGFVIHYRRIVPPTNVDVVMVAPKAQGRGVRAAFQAGDGVAALVAVHQDASGQALQTALAWAAGIGSARSAIFQTTFADETETDLFGEQAVLCGGLSSLISAGFETLVDAGYPPELAYLECCHEVKLLADLIQESGISGMRDRISSTARFGDLTRGPRIIDARVRETMREVLAEIRSGEFARELADDFASAGNVSRGLLASERSKLIESIGTRIREAILPRNLKRKEPE